VPARAHCTQIAPIWMVTELLDPFSRPAQLERHWRIVHVPLAER
jgi:hypothetical protein